MKEKKERILNRMADRYCLDLVSTTEWLEFYDSLSKTQKKILLKKIFEKSANKA